MVVWAFILASKDENIFNGFYTNPRPIKVYAGKDRRMGGHIFQIIKNLTEIADYKYNYKNRIFFKFDMTNLWKTSDRSPLV